MPLFQLAEVWHIEISASQSLINWQTSDMLGGIPPLAWARGTHTQANHGDIKIPSFGRSKAFLNIQWKSLDATFGPIKNLPAGLFKQPVYQKGAFLFCFSKFIPETSTTQTTSYFCVNTYSYEDHQIQFKKSKPVSTGKNHWNRPTPCPNHLPFSWPYGSPRANSRTGSTQYHLG